MPPKEIIRVLKNLGIDFDQLSSLFDLVSHNDR